MMNLDNSCKEVSFQDVREKISILLINHEMNQLDLSCNDTLECLDYIKEKLEDKIVFFLKREKQSFFLKASQITQHNFSINPLKPRWTTTIRIVGCFDSSNKVCTPNIVITLNGSILYNIVKKEIYLVDKVDSNPISIPKKH